MTPALAQKVAQGRRQRAEACRRAAEAHGSSPHAAKYAEEAAFWDAAADAAEAGFLAPVEGPQ